MVVHSAPQWQPIVDIALQLINYFLIIHIFGFHHFETGVCLYNLGMSRTIQKIVTLILLSEICILSSQAVSRHNHDNGDCEL